MQPSFMIASYLKVVDKSSQVVDKPSTDITKQRISNIWQKIETVVSELRAAIRLSLKNERAFSKTIISDPVYLDNLGAALLQFIVEKTSGIALEVISTTPSAISDRVHFFGSEFGHLTLFKTKFRVTKVHNLDETNSYNFRNYQKKTVFTESIQQSHDIFTKIETPKNIRSDSDNVGRSSLPQTVTTGIEDLLSGKPYLKISKKNVIQSTSLSPSLSLISNHDYTKLLKIALKKQIDWLLEMCLQEAEKNPNLLEQFITSSSPDNLHKLYEKILSLNFGRLKKMGFNGI